MQTLSWHVGVPTGHTLLQLPQFRESLEVATHLPPQLLKPFGIGFGQLMV
jgi:hypothetical protein